MAEGLARTTDGLTLVAYMYLPGSICAGVPCGVPCFTSDLESSCFMGVAADIPFCAMGVPPPADIPSSFTTWTATALNDLRCGQRILGAHAL